MAQFSTLLYSSWDRKESDTTKGLNWTDSFHLLADDRKGPHSNFREGNGTPLQYSCLENPMGRGAW